MEQTVATAVIACVGGILSTLIALLAWQLKGNAAGRESERAEAKALNAKLLDHLQGEIESRDAALSQNAAMVRENTAALQAMVGESRQQTDVLRTIKDEMLLQSKSLAAHIAETSPAVSAISSGKLCRYPKRSRQK